MSPSTEVNDFRRLLGRNGFGPFAARSKAMERSCAAEDAPEARLRSG
jgi:hypothetical protein